MTVTPDFAAIPDYAAIVRDGQHAVRTATDAYAQIVRVALTELPTAAPLTVPTVTDAQATVDRLYDHARGVVEIQRDLVKQLVSAGK